MKIRGSIFWSGLAIAGLVVLLLWQHTAKRLPSSGASGGTVVRVSATGTSRKNNSVNSNSTFSAGTMANTTTSLSAGQPKDLSLSNKMEVLRAVLRANDADIVFYGRLVDQFSNGVSDADINFGIQYQDDKGSGTYHGRVTSDASGAFTISGYKGENLGFMPTKAGYALATRSTEFRYSQLQPGYFVPDSNHPVIIRMWRLEPPQQLISFDITAYLPVNGVPVSFDFFTGSRVPDNGDITIRIHSPTVSNIREEYDWEASIHLPSGGIIESGLGFDTMFEAPQSGYLPEFEVSFHRATPEWTPRFIDGFYFRSRGRMYGKIAIKILTDVVKDGAVPVTLNGYINPAGSRNLEIDPNLVTKAHP